MAKREQDAEFEPGTRFLTANDVRRVTTLRRTTIWKLEREGKFPRGHRLRVLPSRKVWFEAAVLRWMREQVGAFGEDL